MAAQDYPPRLARVESGEFDLGRLVRRCIGLAEAALELAGLGSSDIDGITVIDPTADRIPTKTGWDRT
jgi:hypothetical protein